MSELVLRPRTPSELVDTAFQVFRRDPALFVAGAALIYVPWLLIRVILDIGINPDVMPDLSQFPVIVIGGIAVYTLAGGVTAVMASDVYLGRQPDLGRAFREVATHIVPLVVTMIITTLFIVFGLLLLLLPALYPIARFFATRQVILLENGGVGRALSRSSELSLGTKRHILNTLILVGLLTLAISIGAGFVTSMIGSHLVQQVVSTAVSAMIYPMFGITETLLYYDVRIRKEGFDIEYLASSFEQAPAAT